MERLRLLTVANQRVGLAQRPGHTTAGKRLQGWDAMRNHWTCILLTILFDGVGRFADSQDLSSPSLIQRTGCAHLSLVHGRLRMDPSRYCKLRREEPLSDPEGTESVSVCAQHGSPSLHYVRYQPGSRISIDCTEGSVLLEWNRLTDSGSLHFEYRQPAEGPSLASLKSPTGNGTGEYCSIWHFCAAERELYQQWLKPLLEIAAVEGRPTEPVLRELDLRLLELAAQGEGCDQERVRFLVGSLGSRSHTERVKAQQQLLGMGVGVLPALERIDLRSLDAEQRQRLNHIRDRLQPLIPDDPIRVARWLRTDWSYWQLAASRWTSVDQSLAASYCRQNGGGELSFSRRPSPFAASHPIAEIAELPLKHLR